MTYFQVMKDLERRRQPILEGFESAAAARYICSFSVPDAMKLKQRMTSVSERKIISKYMEEAKALQRDDLFNMKNNIDTKTNGKMCEM
ncbi:hypothetical protein HGM15179_008506 [Zosterops borbonicus]|uniref:Uncharacterized protein n=1 Tax=Zosterops borbonicus TaxID=364589 RepID=A0A8K1GIY8_9PASS|nr:hypothetical protein HGM15179_008506 [Zosterops borbonicus]